MQTLGYSERQNQRHEIIPLSAIDLSQNATSGIFSDTDHTSPLSS
jgi:hypothetical protein